MRRFAGATIVRLLGAGLLMFLAAGCLPRGLHAGETGVEALGGWEGDSRSQGYGFAGGGVLFPAGETTVVPLRVFGSYLYYNFVSAGTTTQVTSPGISIQSGIRFVGKSGTLTLLGGGEVRREHRDSDAPGAEPEEKSTTGIVLQLDGDQAFGRRWRGYLLANYGGASQYLFGRVAARCQLTNVDWKKPVSFFAGLEAVRQGNDESDAGQAGAFVEWNFTPKKLSLILRGGTKESWSPGEEHIRGGYYGIGMYHRF
jgi:cellulose biosynthesis protein BcsS